MARRDVFLASLLEAALILIPAVVGWLSRTPFVFASLGPTLARSTPLAALSTTLSIALGIMQTVRDGDIIMLAVLLITAISEPLRGGRVNYALPEKS